MQNTGDQYHCQVCHKQLATKDMIKIRSVQPYILSRIANDVSVTDTDGMICVEDLNRYRTLYLREMIEHAKGDLTRTEEDVFQALKEGDTISLNAEESYSEKLSFGQLMADKVARFGGSWVFIGSFAAVLVAWIIINTLVLATRAYDPYPFILLNLMLSCLAAIQAPIIMMSQNRQESKDRLRSQNDYQVNLKAELEVRILNQKLDYLTREWIQSLEIQEIQTNLLEELMQQMRNNGPSKA